MNTRQKKRYYPTNHRIWLKIRKRILDKEPLCRECKKRGRNTPASHVDHIDGQCSKPSDYVDSNLQPLCNSCHSRKTAAFDGSFGQKEQRRILGCDENGIPLDERHYWNTKGVT